MQQRSIGVYAKAPSTPAFLEKLYEILDCPNNSPYIAWQPDGTAFLIKKVPELLINIQENLFSQALQFREKNTHTINKYDELKTIIKQGGFVRCGWDGKASTEAKIKEETKATIRCIPLDEKPRSKMYIFSITGKT